MDKLRIETFTGGWVVGDFLPSMFQNPHVEVGVKFFGAGATEKSHAQIVSTEITIIHEGSVRIGSSLLKSGDVFIIYPGEFADFEAMSDGSLTCIKFPSIPSDKILE